MAVPEPAAVARLDGDRLPGVTGMEAELKLKRDAGVVLEAHGAEAFRALDGGPVNFDSPGAVVSKGADLVESLGNAPAGTNPLRQGPIDREPRRIEPPGDIV